MAWWEREPEPVRGQVVRSSVARQMDRLRRERGPALAASWAREQVEAARRQARRRRQARELLVAERLGPRARAQEAPLRPVHRQKDHWTARAWALALPERRLAARP